MSDAVPVVTKSATGGSPKATSAKTKTSRTRISRADWRIFTRDAYATVFDTLGDWVYLFAIYNRDYNGDGDADEYVQFHVDYITLVHVVLAFCVLSTVFTVWIIFTMFGRSCGNSSVFCNCTIPKLALVALLLEDLPQLLLTAYIDYGFSGQLSQAGMLNICSSLNALVNRITSRYDEIKYEDNNDNDDVYKAMP